jgi:hypothetical protein
MTSYRLVATSLPLKMMEIVDFHKTIPCHLCSIDRKVKACDFLLEYCGMKTCVMDFPSPSIRNLHWTIRRKPLKKGNNSSSHFIQRKYTENPRSHGRALLCQPGGGRVSSHTQTVIKTNSESAILVSKSVPRDASFTISDHRSHALYESSCRHH